MPMKRSVRRDLATLHPNVVGAGWMLLSAAAFTLMTTLVKYLGGHYSSAVETFYRQLSGLIILAPVILRHGRAALITERMGMQIFRALATVAGLTLTFESFRLLPLATANALSFTRVLWVVPLAIVFLKERVGPVRLGAIVVGFAGVLVMLRPQEAQAGWPSLAALSGALLLAFANMSVKSLAGGISMRSLLCWAALLGTVLSLPAALLTWRWPSPGDLALLAAMGVAGIASQYAYIAGLRLGDTAVVVPVDYSRLVMAALVGFFLFGETPDALTLAGAAIVIGSTLFIIWREQQLAKAARRRAGAAEAKPA
jgi:drug/metabolite transporter (DMT)-like permease